MSWFVDFVFKIYETNYIRMHRSAPRVMWTSNSGVNHQF